MQNDFYDISKFLSNSKLIDIASKYEAIKNYDSKIGLNIFRIISDTYHRENLHSDIIKFFLDPIGNHHEGDKFLKYFLLFLNENGAKITEEDFQDCNVVREEGRVDILIKSDHALSKDTYRQLPDYVNKLKLKEFEIVTVIYLSLDGNKTPVLTDWSKDEKEEIGKKLLRIAAYNSQKKCDLLNGWILPCIDNCENKEVKIILQHYSNLIKYLRGNIMETKELKEFYEILKTDNNYLTATAIKNMMDDLGKYLAEQIVIWYNKNPFTLPFNLEPYVYHEITAVFGDWHLRSSQYVLVIRCENQKYLIRFFDRQNKWEYNSEINALMAKHGFIEDDTEYNLAIDISIDDEKIFPFLEALLRDINEFDILIGKSME